MVTHLSSQGKTTKNSIIKHRGSSFFSQSLTVSLGPKICHLLHHCEIVELWDTCTLRRRFLLWSTLSHWDQNVIYMCFHTGKPDDVLDKNYQWEAAGVGVKWGEIFCASTWAERLASWGWSTPWEGLENVLGALDRYANHVYKDFISHRLFQLCLCPWLPF